MCKDYLILIKEKFKAYSEQDFEVGKTAEFHISRGGKTISEIKKEILSCKFLKAVNKEEKSGEERYTLYFIYNKRKGMRYTITLRGKNIRLITTIPMGSKTIQKADRTLKKKFKKMNLLDNIE